MRPCKVVLFGLLSSLSYFFSCDRNDGDRRPHDKTSIPGTGISGPNKKSEDKPTLLATGLAPDSKVIYVKISDTASSADGLSWAKAYGNLETALENHKEDNELTLVVSADSPIHIGHQINLGVFRDEALDLWWF